MDGYHVAVAPPILSGHGIEAHNQRVVGATTLALLRKHIGDSATFSFGSPNTAPLYLPPTKLLTVGTVIFPAIGGQADFADHPSMGTGALLSAELSPAFVRASASPDPNQDGPGVVFVRLRSEVSTAVGLADMNRIATLANAVFARDRNTFGDTVDVIGVQRYGNFSLATSTSYRSRRFPFPSSLSSSERSFSPTSAAIPARIAARTPAALALRSE